VTEGVDSDGDVADGVVRRLDPRYISHQQRVGWITTAFLTGLAFLAAVVFWASTRFSLAGLAAAGALWIAFSGFMAWHAQAWPEIAYRHASYRVDAEGIEIRRGVFWRTIVNIPRSRVQHTDVSQGPLERTHELGTLVVYTAGTDHARVDLPGLTHARALRIREHLLPKGEGDAV
jgi:membrane protein YdbS with pleckstrin-like domain